MDAKDHVNDMEHVKMVILEGTAKWEAKVAITGNMRYLHER